jgi:ubiquinone/menaquinone biosynthesis C-methylase UbiE
MNKRTVMSHYDSTSGEWIKDLTKQPNKYYYSMYFRNLFDKGLKGKRAIDLGSGAGIFTFELSKSRFDEIHALDISDEMLRSLDKERVRRSIRKINLKKGDIENTGFKDRYFDFVVTVGAIECLDRPEKALKEIERLLKKGGRASIRFANSESVWELVEDLKKKVGKPSDPFFTQHYRMRDMEAALRELGFEVTEKRGCVLFAFFLLPRWLDSFLTLLLIKTKVAYLLENLLYKNELLTRKLFYSYVVKVKKVR